MGTLAESKDAGVHQPSVQFRHKGGGFRGQCEPCVATSLHICGEGTDSDRESLCQGSW